MKHHPIRISLNLLLVGVCTLALQSLSPSRSAQAQFGQQRGPGCCDHVSGRGRGAATAADTFVVDAEFNLSGGQFGGAFGAQSLQIKSTTRLLAQNPPTANGTINAITSHVFEVKGASDEDGICEPGEDCLVTLDRAALIPTTTPGLMDLRSVLAISDGQGRFTKACGKIDSSGGDGQINFAATPPTVQWSFSGGRLCQCP
jgi:hypothetical protein